MAKVIQAAFNATNPGRLGTHTGSLLLGEHGKWATSTKRFREAQQTLLANMAHDLALLAELNGPAARSPTSNNNSSSSKRVLDVDPSHADGIILNQFLRIAAAAAPSAARGEEESKSTTELMVAVHDKATLTTVGEKVREMEKEEDLSGKLQRRMGKTTSGASDPKVTFEVRKFGDAIVKDIGARSCVLDLPSAKNTFGPKSMDTVLSVFAMPGRGGGPSRDGTLRNSDAPFVPPGHIANQIAAMKSMLKVKQRGGGAKTSSGGGMTLLERFNAGLPLEDASKGNKGQDDEVQRPSGRLLCAFWYDSTENWYQRQMLNQQGHCDVHWEKQLDAGEINREFHWKQSTKDCYAMDGAAGMEGLHLSVPSGYPKVPWDGIHGAGGLMDEDAILEQEKKMVKLFNMAGFHEDNIRCHWLHHRIGQTKSGELVVSSGPSANNATPQSKSDKKNDGAGEEEIAIPSLENSKQSFSDMPGYQADDTKSKKVRDQVLEVYFDAAGRVKEGGTGFLRSEEQERQVNELWQTFKSEQEEKATDADAIDEGLPLQDLLGQWYDVSRDRENLHGNVEAGMQRCESIYKNIAVQSVRDRKSKMTEEFEEGSGAEHVEMISHCSAAELRLPLWNTVLVVEAVVE